MNNLISKRAPETASPERKTASFVAARCVIACGALLAASGYGVSTAFGAPPFVPIVAANEQAVSNEQTRDAKPDAVKSAAAKPAEKPGTAASPDMSTHVAAQLKTTPQSFAPLSYFAANCARCHGPNGSFFGESFGKNRDDASLRQIVHDMAFGPAQAPLDDARLEVLVAYNRSLIDKKPFVTLSSATLGRAPDISKILKKAGTKTAINEKKVTSRAPGIAPKRGAETKSRPSKASPPKAASPKTTQPKATQPKPTASAINRETLSAKPGIGHLVSGTPILTLKGEATPDAKVIVKQGAQTIQAQRTGDSWTATLPAASIASPIEITTEKDGIQTVLRPAQNAFSHAAMQAENTTVGAANKSK